MRALVSLGVAALLAAAAFAAAPDTKQSSRPAAPVPGPLLSDPAVSGTILETMDSGGYTYMLLRTNRGDVWTAVNQAKVKKGSVATVVNPAEMVNFESKTLRRKFDRILFGTLAQAPGKAGTGGPSSAEMKAAMATQHSAAASGPSNVGPIKVDRAVGGKTVAEIFAQRATLKDKEIVVRGKVVKYTPEVMGKNWIHLRDGSGSREKKDDDITVTTRATAAIGDVVLVRGVVRLDKDFGAGYTYSVILEDAKVSK
jgi:hypothetical protein